MYLLFPAGLFMILSVKSSFTFVLCMTELAFYAQVLNWLPHPKL